jgi:lysozyme family protein
MREDFGKALDRVLVYEGGYSNHPRDPGGETNKGIIKRVYDGYRRSKGLEPRSVRKITDEELREIYRTQYWDAIQGDRLPAGVDLAVFDGAVNSGPGQSAKWLQRALQAAGLYHGDIDGHLGEGTLGAIEQHPDHDALIADMLARRLGMLQNLSTFDAFGKGWTARVVSVKDIGQAWASGSVGPAPVPVHEQLGDAKAYAGDIVAAPVAPEVGTAAAGGGGGAAAIIQGATDTLKPLIGASPWARNVYLLLVTIAALIAVAGVGYALWAAYKNRKAKAAIDGGIVASFHDAEYVPAARKPRRSPPPSRNH